LRRVELLVSREETGGRGEGFGSEQAYHAEKIVIEKLG